MIKAIKARLINSIPPGDRIYEVDGVSDSCLGWDLFLLPLPVRSALSTLAQTISMANRHPVIGHSAGASFNLCRLSNCHFFRVGFSHAQMLLNNRNCLGNRFLQLVILRGGLRLLKSRKIVRVILYHQVDVLFIKALSG
jgi:hypothetical protein